MDLGIAGRVALVTASSQGLGKASALCLAREGCKVMLNGRRADACEQAAKEIQADAQVHASGGSVEWCLGDLTEAADITHLLETTVHQLGPIDILIANTGGPPAGHFADHADDQRWLDAYTLLVMAPVRLCRGVIPSMAARGWGRIVFITSTAITQPHLHLALSSIIRPAVAGLSKTLAREYADRGITANVVLPGPYDTARSIETLRLQSEKTGKSIEALQAERAASVPLKRSGDPMELGAAVAWLASEPAAFTTGAMLRVDGGVTESIW